MSQGNGCIKITPGHETWVWRLEMGGVNMEQNWGSVQFSSVAQSCPTLCDPMNLSTPGLPVHHQFLGFIQINVHWVSDAISSSVINFSSCPLPFPASESFQMSQLFASGGKTVGSSASASVLPIMLEVGIFFEDILYQIKKSFFQFLVLKPWMGV